MHLDSLGSRIVECKGWEYACWVLKQLAFTCLPMTFPSPSFLGSLGVYPKEKDRYCFVSLPHHHIPIHQSTQRTQTQTQNQSRISMVQTYIVALAVNERIPLLEAGLSLLYVHR